MAVLPKYLPYNAEPILKDWFGFVPYIVLESIPYKGVYIWKVNGKRARKLTYQEGIGWHLLDGKGQVIKYWNMAEGRKMGANR